MRRAIIGMAVLAVAGCSDQQPGATPGNAAANRAEAPAAPSPPPAPAPVPAKDVTIERKDDVLAFVYSWPGAAASVGPLGAWLRHHADGQYAQARKEAEEGRQAAREGQFPFRAYSYEQHWSVAADTPAVLVLASDGYTFTGGAHGMPFASSLIWDRATGRRIATGAMLDARALAGAARAGFCKELDRQRAEKRGGPVDPGADDGVPEFNQCVDMAEQEIVPISRSGAALDAFRVIIGPYIAGPYAEGSYTVDLPVTPALLAAVKPAYRGWFAAAAAQAR